MSLPSALTSITEAFPYPLLFATVSGAHLYGFESADSDYDLRGCHVLPVRELVGLREPVETEERLGDEAGLELDLVSHDVRKFCRMLVKPNGYVLEQLTSPLVVVTTPAHEELLALVPRLVTRHHAHHYLGFAHNQWKLFSAKPRVKSLLYVYRVLLTGIHLMRSGRLCASLPQLLEEHPQDGVADLIAMKRDGAEKQALDAALVAPHAAAFERLVRDLETAREQSQLPDENSAFDAIDALVRRVRLEGSV